jgi:hypothetical protein
VSIELPSIDELERFYVEHPDAFATTCDDTACLIAMPLRDRYPDVIFIVSPDPSGVWGMVDVMSGADSIALPDDLNALAVDFDHLLGRDEDNNDDDDDVGSSELRLIRAEDCVTFIRAFKERRHANRT